MRHDSHGAHPAPWLSRYPLHSLLLIQRTEQHTQPVAQRVNQISAIPRYSYEKLL